MTTNSETTRRPALGAGLRDTAFFILFWLYLWLVVDLRLIAHCTLPAAGELPVFYRGWTFFRESMAHPGGPAEYVGPFLFQLFSHAWMGALAVTGLAWLLSLCVSGCFSASGLTRLRCLRHVPALLLLAIYSQYAHYLTSTVALVAALCLIPPYLKISAKGTPAALAFFIVVSPVLYYTAGATYLVFAAACIVYEVLVTRRWRLVVPCLLFAAAVPCSIGMLLCAIPPPRALIPHAFSWNVEVVRGPLWALYLLYLLVPAGFLLSGVAGWGWGRQKAAPVAEAGEPLSPEKRVKKSQRSSPTKTAKKPPQNNPWAAAPKLLRFAQLILPFVLATGTAWFTFNPGKKCLLTVDFYASCGMWERVLEAARVNPTYPAVVEAVNRALYHTGRMAEELFSHPQSAALLTGNRVGSWQWTQIWLDSGFVNVAEHEMAQAQEIVGEQPAILRTLALMHLAKGNIGTAKIYLKALSRTLFGNEWANSYLKKLEEDPALSSDRPVQWLRSTMPKTAALIKDHSTEQWFLELLNRNPKNRPAFEYLMALYLVQARPEKVVENIHRLNDFDFPRPYLPEHYAEAVSAHLATRGGNPNLHGWQIRPETKQRLQACMEIAGRHKGDPIGLKRELRQNYPGSYFRYLLTGESGRP